ncbi:hypothetical protein [Mycobacterium haemophilum]|uniref:hypothetical protein n=1 Tax=Mycobacterium haemophilum TaxID=29311 RepID=UPI000B2DC180|nr:hypothetical protein [Mycobacterium haemophilum]
MIATPEEGRILWRVGYYTDPLGFTPIELYQFSHRFDDFHRRFRTLYCADLAETYLREVLADFRPNLDAMRRHVERYGPAVLQLDGPLVDLTDVPTRQQIEHRHVDFLLEHDLQHLDLHEITAPAPSAFPLAWTATHASHCSRGAAPRAWRETRSRSPTRRPNRSPMSSRPGAWCLSQRGEIAPD